MFQTGLAAEGEGFMNMEMKIGNRKEDKIMKRFGILALAGVLAIVGCSKKVERQTKAAEQTQAVAKLLSGSQKSAKRVAQLGKAARSGALGPIARAVDPTLTYDATQKGYTFSGTDEGYAYTALLQLLDASGNSVGDFFNPASASSNTVVDATKVTVTATGSDNRTMTATYTGKGYSGSYDANGNPKAYTLTYTGSGKWDDPKEKTNGTFTETGSESYDALGALTSESVKVSITGTADGDSFTLDITKNKDGSWDGTGTVNAEAITTHINADGSGTWTDSKGEKHDFKADS